MISKVVTLIFSLAVLLRAQASAQSVDELVKKDLGARGELEKLKAIKSLMPRKAQEKKPSPQ